MNLRAHLPAFFAGAICMLIGFAALHGDSRGVQSASATPAENNWPYFFLSPDPQDAGIAEAIADHIKQLSLPYKRVEASGFRGFAFRMQVADGLEFRIDQGAPGQHIAFSFKGNGEGQQLARQQADLWFAFVNERFPDHAVWEMLVGKQIAHYSRPARGAVQ
jgi:hypothetical protein